MKLVNYLIALLMMVGCSTMRYPIAEIKIISMSDTIPVNGPAPKRGKDVSAKECPGFFDTMIDLIDKVTWKAQHQSGARYIKNSTIFWHEHCIVIEGEGWY